MEIVWLVTSSSPEQADAARLLELARDLEQPWQPVVGRGERLLQVRFAATVRGMSTVDLTVRRVKKLSDRQAGELLGWLDARQSNDVAGRSQAAQRKSAARRRMKKLMAWHDSVRLTTDWEPPRMPDDLTRTLMPARRRFGGN